MSYKSLLVGGLSLGTRFGIDRLDQLKAMAVIYILFFLYCTVILVTAAHRGFTPEQSYLLIMLVYMGKFSSIFISA